MSKFILVLNDMRSGKIETPSLVLAADTRKELEEYLEENEAPWKDGQWSKTYKKGSFIEWCNPPCPMFNHGIILLPEPHEVT